MRSCRSLPLLLGVSAVLLSCGDSNSPSQTNYQPRTRRYYVAAEDTVWNYAPLDYDSVYHQPVPSPWGDSLRYHKVRYVEYTDNTFTTRVPQPATNGILGPMLRAVVGDTMKVTLLNRATYYNQPFSMHPHGVRYDPKDEGAVYYPPRHGGAKVAPGHRYTYTWFAEKESGPFTGEPSSKVWLYHDHVDHEMGTYLGLEGTIVITDPAHAKDDASPDDVDREFTTLWFIYNENTDLSPPADEEMNLKHSINGLFFGNLRNLVMNQGDRVRWYLVALGTEVDLHTPHWHGEKITLEGRAYTDVVELLPASMKVGDMVADNPGVWILHCHVGDHFTGGMYTTFTILDGVNPAPPMSTARMTDAADGWFGFHDVGLVAPMPTMGHQNH